MVTYSGSLITSDQIAREIHAMDEQLKTIYQGVQHVESVLTSMETKYGDFVTEVNQQDINDREWLAMQGKVSKLVADFNALKTYATAVRQAVEQVR